MCTHLTLRKGGQYAGLLLTDMILMLVQFLADITEKCRQYADLLCVAVIAMLLPFFNNIQPIH